MRELLKILSKIHYQLKQKNRGLKIVMGRLDDIQAALDAAGSTAAEEALQVSAHFDELRTQVADLQAALDSLSAGSVTDEEIAAIVAQAQGLSATIENIDTEGDDVPEEEVPSPPDDEELPTP